MSFSRPTSGGGGGGGDDEPSGEEDEAADSSQTQSSDPETETSDTSSGSSGSNELTSGGDDDGGSNFNDPEATDSDSGSSRDNQATSGGDDDGGSNFQGEPNPDEDTSSSNSTGPTRGSDNTGESNFQGEPNPDEDTGSQRDTELIRGANDDGFDRDAAEATASVRLNQQVEGVDIGPDDVEIRRTENGFTAGLDIEAQEEAQSAQINSLRQSAAEQFGVDPSDVEVEETADGFTASVRDGTTVEGDGFDLFSPGDDVPESGEDAVDVTGDLLTGDGAELIETDLPTNQRESQLAVRGTFQDALNIEAEPVEASDIVDEARETARNPSDAGPVATAGAAGVATPEPSTSIGGGLLLAGAATASAVGSQVEIEAPEDNSQSTGELSVEEETFTTELDVEPDAVESQEIGVPDEPAGTQGGEVDVPENRGDQQTGGEVDAPTADAQTLVDPELVDEEDDRNVETDDGTIIIGEEDIEDTGPLVEIPEEEQMEQIRDQLERRQDFVRDEVDPGEFDDADAFDFVDEGATGEEQVNQDVSTEPGVDTGTTTGGATGTASGSIEDVFAPPAPPENAVDQATGAQSDVEAGVDTRVEADVVSAPGDVIEPPAFDPAFADPAAQEPAFETATPASGPPEETGRGRPPRDLDIGFDDDDDEQQFESVEAALNEEAFEFDLPTPDFLGGDNG